jgi:hypothetical protein
MKDYPEKLNQAILKLWVSSLIFSKTSPLMCFFELNGYFSYTVTTRGSVKVKIKDNLKLKFLELFF